MQVFVSLHTDAPLFQIDQEVSYPGYHRVPIEFGENFGTTSIPVLFPIIQSDSEDIVTYTAIGAAETGQGEIFMRIPTMPMELKAHPERLTKDFWMKNGANEEQVEELIAKHGHIAPRVIIANTNPVVLPENLNPIARIAHNLVYSGLMSAADLHPKLYEAINDALHNAGVPVLTVTRGGAARFDAKMSNLKSIAGWGSA